MGNAVVHFEVVGRDLEKLQAFYSDLFDWKMESIPEMKYAIVEKEGEGIGGGIGQSDNDGPGYVTFYVSTDDPQATLDKAEQLGGKTLMPVTEMPAVTIAIFADPEGHIVGLVKA